jgi:hypothetical protein
MVIWNMVIWNMVIWALASAPASPPTQQLNVHHSGDDSKSPADKIDPEKRPGEVNGGCYSLKQADALKGLSFTVPRRGVAQAFLDISEEQNATPWDNNQVSVFAGITTGKEEKNSQGKENEENNVTLAPMWPH